MSGLEMLTSAGVEEGRGSAAVTAGTRKVLFPFHKDFCIVGSDTVPLPGQVICSMFRNIVYVPECIPKLLRKHLKTNE